MDTTRENFEEVLPEVLEAIQGCAFVALDLEMSGISLTDPQFRTNYGDTPQERYAKMRPVASRYNIIQLGLCTFTKGGGKGGKKQGADELVARPFNIYTCADEVGMESPDGRGRG